MTFKALLWDCDGCLIDSEYIACSLSASLLTEAGYPITTEDFIVRFCGQGNSHIFKTIEDETGVDYRAFMDAVDKKAKQREAFKKDLKAIQGIHEVLDVIDLPMAIASGSEMDRLTYTLQLTDLYDRFAEHIYSSSLVAKGKPAPDIFLYAAEKLNTAPQDCLVVEDSLNGVRSGKAARMTVFGFTGGGHVPDKKQHEKLLYDLGADIVFHDMHELPSLIKNYARKAA